ncbi:MAG: hypothetical protein AB7V27_00770 [Candidatus Binatia bacterium]
MSLRVCALIVAAALLLATPSAFAAEAPGPQNGAPAAPCAHAKDGACCGTCQEQKMPAAEKAGGCPCQRAKQAAEQGAAGSKPPAQ